MDSRMTSASPGAFSHTPSTSSSSSSRSTSPNPPLPLNSTLQDPFFRPPLPPALPALVLRKMIALQLVETGFEAGENEAIEFLEGALYSFFGTLLNYAHDLAELARRHEPTLEDVVQGCREMGLVESTRDLYPSQLPNLASSSSSSTSADLSIRYARSSRRRAKSPVLLPSDDEHEAFSDPEPDPAFESPPASPSRSADWNPGDDSSSDDDDDDDDDEDEFEEVVPMGADGQPIPGAKEAKDAKKRDKEQRRKDRGERRKERDRRRKAREFRKNEYGGTFEASWAPKLPPKHSWKQTPVFPEQPPPPPIPAPVSRTAQAPSKLALAHLSTLRSRLNDSQLVASSLRNLIRRTGASARGGNPYTTSSAIVTGEGGTAEEVQVAAEVAAEQEADLVSYENEWYGSNKIIAKSALAFKKGKRNVRTIRVGDKERKGDEEGESSDEERREGIFGTTGGGGGVAKRRRWLV
ncbi:hypothetical protein JCM16303_001438 [Sporobolomyces ruberrimus]